MSISAEIIRGLAGLNLPAKKFAAAAEIVLTACASDDARRKKDVMNKALYRSRGGGAIPPDMRQAVFERDEFACVYCSATDDLTMDHVHPVSKGGETTLENLVVACRSCNSRKRDRDRKFLERSARRPGINSDAARTIDGNSTEHLSPEQKVSPITPSKTQPLSEQQERASEVHSAFLAAIGATHDDRQLFGSIHSISAFLARGFSRETILAGAVRAMTGKNKPPNWTYFSKVIETENDERSAPAKQENRNGKISVQDAAQQLVDDLRAFDEPAPDLRGRAIGYAPRLLSNG